MFQNIILKEIWEQKFRSTRPLGRLEHSWLLSLFPRDHPVFFFFFLFLLFSSHFYSFTLQPCRISITFLFVFPRLINLMSRYLIWKSLERKFSDPIWIKCPPLRQSALWMKMGSRNPGPSGPIISAYGRRQYPGKGAVGGNSYIL